MESRHRDQKVTKVLKQVLNILLVQQKLEDRILDFQSKNPEDLESQLQERQNMLDVYQTETNVRKFHYKFLK